jgi:hypothetical protein
MITGNTRRMERAHATDVAFGRAKASMEREEAAYYILSVLVLLLSLLIYIFPSVKMVNLVYRENQARAIERRIMAEQNRLKLRYEMMMAPEEMERRAFGAGFSAASLDRIVYITKK